MATLLDIGVLETFKLVFPFLFVLVIGGAILSRVPWFKENPALAWGIAFILAVLAMFSRIAVKTILLMAPWFVLLFLFIIFLLVAYMTFGIKEERIIEVITGKTPGEYGVTFAHWVLAVVLIIGLGSLATVISEEVRFRELAKAKELGANVTAITPEEEKAGFFATITHPKVLGVALLLLVAMFTIQKMTERTFKVE